MLATPEREAARLWRHLQAAGRRVRAARARVAKHRTLENMTAAAELAAGYARMEAAYYETLSEVA
jgi:hypothetical protein